MIYFSTNSDMAHLMLFRIYVLNLKAIEEKVPMSKDSWMIGSRSDIQDVVISKAAKTPGYEELREAIAKAAPRAKRIATLAGLPLVLKNFPPAAVGGPVIPVNIFDSVLRDDSYAGVETRRVIETIDGAIGQLESKRQVEFWRVINPFFWLFEFLRLILRIPFIIFSAMGFNVAKVEEGLGGKLIKLATAILTVVGLLLKHYLGS